MLINFTKFVNSMNSKRNILFSWILLIGFFIPISINFAHSFEHEDHNLCTAKGEKHIHKLENDCSVYHYTVHSFIPFIAKIKIATIKTINTVIIVKTSVFKDNIIVYKNSRAPPFL